MAWPRIGIGRSRRTLIVVLWGCALVSVLAAGVVDGDSGVAQGIVTGIVTDTEDEDAPALGRQGDPAHQHQHGASPGVAVAAQQEPLGRSCDDSDLQEHDGYEVEGTPRCVTTAMGEVPAAAQAPQLLITEAPETVRAGVDFTLTISTRNLLRDRFPPAADGGLYLESAFLTAEGVLRGHLHVGCRHLPDDRETAPSPNEVDAFHAVQDGGGGAAADVVTVVMRVGQPGLAQCVAWAGDGSHRVPMMPRVQQVPAVDAVTLMVTS